MITVAVLDIIDVGRILPVLSEEVFGENIFQRVYCTLGVFHELTVAIFLVSMAIAVCVQAGKEQKVSCERNMLCICLKPFILKIGLLIRVKMSVSNFYSIMEEEITQQHHWHRRSLFH